MCECLDELHKNEGQVKSRPLLDRDPDSVERKIQKHMALVSDVKISLENLKKLCDVGESKVGLPSLIGEMISEARSLLSTLPCELEDRATYLKNNKQSRIDYMDFVAQFNSWIHEAETRLQNGQHGVNYEHIDKDVEDHKKELNKPVGSRIEDVQELLKAYEAILSQLKSNKVDMSSVQMDNIPELKSIILQQDDINNKLTEHHTGTK